MKYLSYITTILLILSIQNSGICQDSLIVFNTSGECYLISQNKREKCQINDVFYQGDTLEIINGSAVIITPALSRTSLKHPGRYGWDQINLRFAEGINGKDNRFFNYLVDLIWKEKIEITSPGGVVRGEEFIEHPFDSAIVLGSILPLRLSDHQLTNYEIWNTHLSKKVANGTFKQQTVIRQADSDWWRPGNYVLNLKIDERFTGSRIFIIPTSEQRNQIEVDYEWLFDAVSMLESIQHREAFLLEMMKLNNIYLLY